MTEPTLTMLKRQRLVTLEEAKTAHQHLMIYSGSCMAPANLSDNNVILNDFLRQLEMTSEQLVKFMRPSAQLYGGHHGKVWIQAGGEMLSDIQYHGTREQRALAAWANAAKRLERIR